MNIFKIQLLIFTILIVNISHAQYNGGDADGFSYLAFAEADNPAFSIYSGSNYDGFSSANFAEADNLATLIFEGGSADGFSYLNFEEADNPQLIFYSGGAADGFAWLNFEEANNPELIFYSGGNADGFAWLNFEEANNPELIFYSGGNADGFAWLNFEEADNPELIFYSGGNADGFAWLNFEKADNPELLLYSGGDADGFAWLNFEEADNPELLLYSGGDADGFAWQNYSVEFYWEGDDLVLPNDWFTPENWSANQVPTNVDDIEIPVVVTNQYPEITGNAVSRTVTIHNGASTTINTDGNYTVSGGFINNGSFDMQADATGKASFIDNGNISGSGTNTIQSFLAGNSYHYVSSPIQTPDTDPLSNAKSDLFTVACTAHNPYFYTYDETYDLDGNPATAPVGAFDPDNLVPGWTYAHSGAGSPHDMNIKTGYADFDFCDKTVNFIGIPHTGTVNYTNLSYTNNDAMPGPLPNYYDGWHLVSNPYPSSIDWDAVGLVPTNLSDFDNAVYVWKGDAITGAYEEYVNGISGGTGLLDRHIPPGQAYFVHATVNNASFEINNSHRSHSSATFLKKGKTDSIKNNLLKLKVEKEGLKTYTTIYFTENSSTEFDGNTDAFKMFGSYSNVPQFYTITPIENLKLSINAMPTDSMKNIDIPLGIRSANGGESQISINEFNGFENIHIYLEDLQFDSLQNLRNNNIYDFNLPVGNMPDRLILHFTENTSPQISEIIENQYILEDSIFELSVKNKFTETDLGDSLIYSATLENGNSLPVWLNFNSETKTFSGIPLNENVGNINVKISASDILQTINFQIFNIQIINTNDAPIVINNIPNQLANIDEYFEYQLPDSIFYDEDLGDILIFSTLNLPNWIDFNSEIRTLSGYPNNVEIVNVEIIATDIAGKSISDIFELTILETVNISEDNNIEVDVYPNPASDFVVINFAKVSNFGKVEMQITDISGKLILEKSITSSETEIDIKQLAVGTYFIEIQNGTEVFIEKIVKK